MIGQRRKAVPQAVDTDIGQAVSNADLMYILPEPVLRDVHDRPGWLALSLQRLFQ